MGLTGVLKSTEHRAGAPVMGIVGAKGTTNPLLASQGRLPGGDELKLSFDMGIKFSPSENREGTPDTGTMCNRTLRAENYSQELTVNCS